MLCKIENNNIQIQTQLLPCLITLNTPATEIIYMQHKLTELNCM